MQSMVIYLVFKLEFKFLFEINFLIRTLHNIYLLDTEFNTHRNHKSAHQAR